MPAVRSGTGPAGAAGAQGVDGIAGMLTVADHGFVCMNYPLATLDAVTQLDLNKTYLFLLRNTNEGTLTKLAFMVNESSPQPSTCKVATYTIDLGAETLTRDSLVDSPVFASDFGREATLGASTAAELFYAALHVAGGSQPVLFRSQLNYLMNALMRQDNGDVYFKTTPLYPFLIAAGAPASSYSISATDIGSDFNGTSGNDFLSPRFDRHFWCGAS